MTMTEQSIRRKGNENKSNKTSVLIVGYNTVLVFNYDLQPIRRSVVKERPVIRELKVCHAVDILSKS